MLRAPFPPLIAGADGLDRPPEPPVALRARMAEIWGVEPEQVVVTRGALHAYELLFRHLRRQGAASIQLRRGLLADEAAVLRLAAREGLACEADAEDAGAHVWAAPAADGQDGPPDAEAARTLLAHRDGPLLVVDESLIDFTSIASVATQTAADPRLVVIRDLSMSHGLAGAPCGALIASTETVAAIAQGAEAAVLATPVARAAEAALSPSRALATRARIAEIVAERDRLLAALQVAGGLQVSRAGPYLVLRPDDAPTARAAFAQFGVEAEWLGAVPSVARVLVRPPGGNEALLAAFGAAAALKPHRRAEQVRDTKETRIVVRLDLDASGEVKVDTGMGFYDHMLEQVAVHGGFNLQVACDGDLHIDPHHVIEDCALALGAALNQALGERRGIARFGFVLPMDEAEARISIDLGGRPYCEFTGEFTAPLVGAFPTQMVRHFFRSIAETMRGAIHLEVRGENDHHKVEACFKGFGRALRGAIRVEGTEMPSSKGVL